MRPALVATISLLSLSCANFGNNPAPTTAVALKPGGNAIVMTIRSGTFLEFSTAAEADQARAALVNETKADGHSGKVLKLTKDLAIVTPAYLQERDAAELLLHEANRRLRLENQRLRGLSQ
jgi:hypothetical protein